MKKHDLVEVQWVDIFGENSGWTDLDDWDEPGEALCMTTGFYLPDIKEGYVVLAGSILEQKGRKTHYHDMSFIPEGVVKRKTRLSRSRAS